MIGKKHITLVDRLSSETLTTVVIKTMFITLNNDKKENKMV